MAAADFLNRGSGICFLENSDNLDFRKALSTYPTLLNHDPRLRQNSNTKTGPVFGGQVSQYPSFINTLITYKLINFLQTIWAIALLGFSIIPSK